MTLRRVVETLLRNFRFGLSSLRRNPGFAAAAIGVFAPVAFVLACVLMTLMGLLEVLLPASRAAGVDPVKTLRDEGGSVPIGRSE